MTEFDFDELDRSIARAMAQDSAAKNEPSSDGASSESNLAVNPENPARVVQGDGVVPQAAVPAGDESTPEMSSSSPNAPAPNAATKPAAKRRGQFMDVVHPSSDMTKSAAARSARRSFLQNGASSPGSSVNSGASSDDDYEDSVDLSMRPEEVDSISVTPNSPFLSEVKPEKRPLDALQVDQKMALSNRMNVIKPLNDNIAPLEENRDKTMPNASDIKKAESRAADVFAAEMASLAGSSGDSIENSVVPDDALNDEPETSQFEFAPASKPAGDENSAKKSVEISSAARLK